MISMFFAIFTITASAAPELGVGPKENLSFTYLQTTSRKVRVQPRGVLCLVATPEPLPPQIERKSWSVKGNTEPCAAFAGGGAAVTVRDFENSKFERSEWDEWEGFENSPTQVSLNAELPGQELHDLYDKLRAECAKKTCRSYYLYVLYSESEGGITGRRLRLPLPKLVPLKSLMMVPMDELGAGEFTITNFQLQSATP